MLIGIVKKNAIMMIDFALAAQRNQGMTAREAIYQGCLIRFRPIMMTTMAALLGTLPIALGFGVGAEARRPLGLAVCGGLIFSQFLINPVPDAGGVHLPRRVIAAFQAHRAEEAAEVVAVGAGAGDGRGGLRGWGSHFSALPSVGPSVPR
jgi:hypothetical protein